MAVFGKCCQAHMRHILHGNLQHHIRRCLTGNASTDKALNAVTGGKINSWVQTYENFVGLTEVKDAQSNVIQAEKRFLQVQEDRRMKQQAIGSLQSKLKALSMEIEKTNRTEDRYLTLLTEEHAVLRDESAIVDQIQKLEKSERDHFSYLSTALRESHEKERARAERTKYWSVIGSVVGAVLGITGTTINNYLRMKELRGIVSDSVSTSSDYKTLTTQLCDTMTSQFGVIEGFISDLKTSLGTKDNFTLKLAAEDVSKMNQNVRPMFDSRELQEQTKEILSIVKRQDDTIDGEIKNIKRILAVENAIKSESNIVYVGPEMEQLIKKSEQNLEWKLKMNSLATVTFIYGACALSLSVVYAMFKGS